MTVAGTKVYLHHTKNADQDKIYIPGPTTEPLTIVVSYFILHALIRSKIGNYDGNGSFFFRVPVQSLSYENYFYSHVK